MARSDTTLGALAERVRPVTLVREHRLPVLPALEGVLAGGGLRRGSVVSVSAAPPAGPGTVARGAPRPGLDPAATSLALALVAAASAAGSWVAGVGLPSLGLAAAAEYGVALERLVLVAAPERASWPAVVASLVDGFDLVLVNAARGVRPTDARRLVARARERGAVLVRLDGGHGRHGAGGGPGGHRGARGGTGGGPGDGADVRLQVVAARWEGLGDGHGHLQARRVTVEAGGRGEAARPRRAELWLPAPGGGIEVALDPPTPLRRPVGTGAGDAGGSGGAGGPAAAGGHGG